jgi:hypothetical protein
LQARPDAKDAHWAGPKLVVESHPDS